MANYTDAATIAAYLATTFTAAQTQQADKAATAVTVWIDHRTDRTWQVAAAIVDEAQPVVNATSIYVDERPIVSVEAISVKGPGNSPWTPLAAGSWTITDAAAGLITIPAQPNNSSARVSYHWPASGAPADLAWAATSIAADMLTDTLNPELVGVDSLSVGQADITLKLSSAAASNDPAALGIYSPLRIVDSYRRVVLA